MKSIIKILFAVLPILIASCSGNTQKTTEEQAKTAEAKKEKIVSISGTTTEILCALGLQDQIVGVDVTSTYPEAMQQLPKVGHNRNMSAEAIIALAPTMVIGVAENVKPELVDQLKAANIRVLLYTLESSVDGTKNLITAVADSLGKTDAVPAITAAIDADLKE